MIFKAFTKHWNLPLHLYSTCKSQSNHSYFPCVLMNLGVGFRAEHFCILFRCSSVNHEVKPTRLRWKAKDLFQRLNYCKDLLTQDKIALSARSRGSKGFICRCITEDGINTLSFWNFFIRSWNWQVTLMLLWQPMTWSVCTGLERKGRTGREPLLRNWQITRYTSYWNIYRTWTFANCSHAHFPN